jgi:hypothetical protein
MFLSLCLFLVFVWGLIDSAATIFPPQDEVVLLHLNDEGESADWGHQSLIQSAVHNAFAPLLFTPTDKQAMFPARWPSLRELRALGKRIIVYGDRIDNAEIFAGFTQPGWDADTMKYFTDYPVCAGYGPGDWAIFGGESQLIGPIYNGTWRWLWW